MGNEEGQKLVLKVTIKEYLKTLQEQEAGKPGWQRRTIPTISQLSEDLSISRDGLSRLFNNRRVRVNLQNLADIVAELRRYGFSTQLGDILSLEESG